MVKTVGEFVDLVSRMREAQKRFFRNHADMDLRAAKAIERQVDDEIKKYFEKREEKKQPRLGF